jgi:hypothetical protein
MGVCVDNFDWDVMDKLEYETDLVVYSDPYDSGGWVGLSKGSMRDDETLRQFKDRAIALLEEAGLDTDVNWIEEAWRDG